ncbi:Periplasmic beta-glucosidase precursor [Serratia rubidaea]|uniref:Periplasmic beta-glucosidase n=1 Tax=Serratia rubidaea TaxID=61652 RepID=A0A4U9HDU5_SERRU|nr:beta-glucosidase BglX [Serratia rubidaea]QPR61852.1 beta-glucosidase BglX [Serratia rubidaea]CAI0935016.1 Periplasmic beta-glucosidase precursor [Serratia rubidaea]CAI1751194.1 Periplasmic beta-glucosidase precursor [Serratia rubidaea]VTP61066.1 Periplasmic beta-glucosidase precursor [Serratia rubidaea]HAY0636710.1 beta-glucosidase BglX [Serratia rubidaea]
MKWLCAVGLVSGLAVSPVFAQESGATQGINVQQRDAFVSKLMKQMTLEEKIGQLRLISVGPDNPKEAIREGIRKGQIGAIFNTVTRPDIRVMQDQAMQLSRLKIPLFFAYDVVHGQRTVFPISLGLAASFDLEAIALSGRVSAQEASDDGLNMTFSPMVDITRDPRWGRVSEGFGEDTWLVSKIAKVMVDAYQNGDPAKPGSVMASVKHFALYGATEGGRDYNTVDMSPLRMQQDYLPPYRAAVDAGSGGVMVSLNSINGIPATANPWLLKDLLRNQWGFGGITISDHGAIKELIKHGVAQDPRDAVRLAITSGVDMSMSDEYYDKYLPGLVKEGLVSESDIDRACRDVLNTKYAMGLFKDPYVHLGPAGSDPQDTNAESRLHRAEARDVARRTQVLLKNDNQTLPLRKQGTIALVGPMADSQRDMMGSWSAAGVSKQSVTLLQGMRNAVGDKAKIIYAKGANITQDKSIIDYLNLYEPAVVFDPRPPQQMIDEAVSAAKQADVVVAVVGESQGMAHEASSRADITIPQSQRDLIKALKATGKPLVLVLMNGRPLALEWESQQADAMLETWFSGTEGGNAVADVLFGDYNPSGKLPMTFPRSVGQIPMYYNHLNTGRPFNKENPGKYTSRYFDSPNGPLYPFGYGLSYSRFTLSDFTLSSPTMARNGKITASVTLKNNGNYDGATVVQLYLQDETASVSRPVKELRNFRKVTLKAGQATTVEMPIDENDLKFYNASLKWGAEPGKFNAFVGLDSAQTLQQSFTLK